MVYHITIISVFLWIPENVTLRNGTLFLKCSQRSIDLIEVMTSKKKLFEHLQTSRRLLNIPMSKGNANYSCSMSSFAFQKQMSSMKNSSLICFPGKVAKVDALKVKLSIFCCYNVGCMPGVLAKRKGMHRGNA